jgi:hypothetical protein
VEGLLLESVLLLELLDLLGERPGHVEPATIDEVGKRCDRALVRLARFRRRRCRPRFRIDDYLPQPKVVLRDVPDEEVGSQCERSVVCGGCSTSGGVPSELNGTPRK